jgi:predicted RND superfamily exporter protein
MAVTVTLGVMMIAFGITVIVIGMTVIVIVRVLMIGLAAACQKQNSDKEGKKRLHSAGTLATLEPLGKPLKRAEPHFSRGHFWNGRVVDWVLSSWNFFHLAR